MDTNRIKVLLSYDLGYTETQLKNLRMWEKLDSFSPSLVVAIDSSIDIFGKHFGVVTEYLPWGVEVRFKYLKKRPQYFIKRFHYKDCSPIGFLL